MSFAPSIISRSFGTHDGSFHADEVTACALLLAYNLIDPDKIVRTRNPSKLEQLEYVCDVGGLYDPSRKRFDHHQNEYNGPLSSAGMVLKHLFDSHVLDKEQYHFLASNLVDGIDAHDIGVELAPSNVTTFSHIISNYLPISPEADPAEFDTAFWQAVSFSLDHIKRLIARHTFSQTCRDVVAKEMNKNQTILLFEHPIPWMDLFYDLGGAQHPALYVIMPSGKNWKLRTIPPTGTTRLQMRKPLPAAWAGLRDRDLELTSGIAGAIFCHKARFISVWASKEAAIKAAEIACQELTTKER